MGARRSAGLIVGLHVVAPRARRLHVVGRALTRDEIEGSRVFNENRKPALVMVSPGVRRRVEHNFQTV